MRYYILTIFPPYFASPLETGLVKKAIDNRVISVEVVDIRSFCTDKHGQVDDYPFGGGAGLVMKPEPIISAIEHVRQKEKNAWVVLLDPSGKRFDQNMALDLSKKEAICVVCGRYEGVDTRIENFVDQTISIGDYVLHGGEVVALVILEAAARLVPGFVKTYESALKDSFPKLLDHPHYTRPREFKGLAVPDVLIGGNHAQIERWRKRESLKRTLLKRPDLLESADLTEEEKKLLVEIQADMKGGSQNDGTPSDKKI